MSVGSQLDIHGGETPHEHVVAPGDVCDGCGRRVPHPKKESSPVSKPLAYRTPLDEHEAHLEAMDAAAEELGFTQSKYHRYVTVSYALALVLQGARLTATDRTDVGDWCVRCGTSAVHTHHRKLRSQGGDDSPANLIRLCVECHNWAHGNPKDAYDSGYLVKSWQNPEDISVGG